MMREAMRIAVESWPVEFLMLALWKAGEWLIERNRAEIERRAEQQRLVALAVSRVREVEKMRKWARKLGQ